MAMMTLIYALCEPDGEIRYIGKTIRFLSTRFSKHLSRARNGWKSHLFSWLRSVLATGHLPLIQLIGEVAGNGSDEERAWITYGRGEGWRLVNATDGGEGAFGYIHSEESRRKISEAKKGLHHSSKTRQKMSEAHKGQVSWNKGKHPSDETRKKLSKSRKGRTPNLGHHHSEESKRKIAEANSGVKNYLFGKHLSEQIRRKISGTLKGTHLSEETRLKISNACKRMWALKLCKNEVET